MLQLSHDAGRLQFPVVVSVLLKSNLCWFHPQAGSKVTLRVPGKVSQEPPQYASPWGLMAKTGVPFPTPSMWRGEWDTLTGLG